jgi:GT2 family glycosyltransferase
MAPSPTTSTPEVTVVVVPRERFSVARRSLTNLYDKTEQPFELVYVDGNSPRRVHHRLREEAGRYGFRLVRTERYLSPNQARNLGLRFVRTPYVVFIDNDVIVTPGWLSALVECAEETGAWVVGTLNFEGDLEDAIVHNAGGFCRFDGPEGSRTLVQENRYGHRHRNELPEDLSRLKVDYVEFHCMLVRRSAFEAIGPLDENLRSTREHLDLCLQVAAAGGEIWSELTSLVTYDHPPPVTLTDLPFFMLRWSEAWNVASLRHFAKKYGLSDKYLERAAASRARRHVVLEPVRSLTRRILGEKVESLVGRGLMGAERLANQILVGRMARSGKGRRDPEAVVSPATVGGDRDALQRVGVVELQEQLK